MESPRAEQLRHALHYAIGALSRAEPSDRSPAMVDDDARISKVLIQLVPYVDELLQLERDHEMAK